MKSFKPIYYFFITCLAIIALLVIVSAFPITHLFGGQAGNYRLLVVQSGSMQPAIKMGSIVVVKQAADYKIGDVITFGPYTRTKAPITHRIHDIKVQGDEPVYITKGDANNAPDQREIAKKDVMGKVLLDVPYLGYAVDVAKKPYGFIFLICLPAGIIIYDEAVKIRKEIVKMKKKKLKQ